VGDRWPKVAIACKVADVETISLHQEEYEDEGGEKDRRLWREGRKGGEKKRGARPEPTSGKGASKRTSPAREDRPRSDHIAREAGIRGKKREWCDPEEGSGRLRRHFSETKGVSPTSAETTALGSRPKSLPRMGGKEGKKRGEKRSEEGGQGEGLG